MSVTKRILGDYSIQPIGGTVFINGNLVVTGNSQSIVSTNSAITDNLITLNHGVTVANPTGAAIEVDRGTTGANVQLRWSESATKWQITNDGVTYYNILATAGTGSGLTSVSGDISPQLGGNLNITGYTLYTTPSKGSVVIYANAAGSGGSGVYVNNTQTNNAELVTKSKAVAYSIVFG